MDLLTNAVESIQSGVDDYGIGTRPRLLSTVRNIHAGILLLYKEALLRMSPAGSDEVLIKERILPRLDPTGNLTFVGVGKKTVDAAQIEERFKALGISTNWAQFKAIAQIRNNVEHYYTTITEGSVQSVITSALLIIRSFMTDELEEDPLTLLGQQTWQSMLDIQEVYDAERNACDGAMDQIDWGSKSLSKGIHQLQCEECGSDLLQPAPGAQDAQGAVLSCRSCGKTRDPNAFVVEALEAVWTGEIYSAAKDGSEEPLGECPECGVGAYVMSEHRCALCGAGAVEQCERCSEHIPASEMGLSPLCSWCDHMMSKDD